MFQYSVDRWVDLYNHARRRLDHQTSLPTGCTADFCYSTPASKRAEDQLVPVPLDKVESILEKDFPDQDIMFEHTPAWLHSVAARIQKQLKIDLIDIAVGDVWKVFNQMLPLVEEEFERHTCSSISSP